MYIYLYIYISKDIISTFPVARLVTDNSLSTAQPPPSGEANVQFGKRDNTDWALREETDGIT